jgi:hypothetical protein
MRLSRTALTAVVLATTVTTLTANSAALAETAAPLPAAHPTGWTLSSRELPVGLSFGVGLKLDSYRVLWLAALADHPADNNRVFLYDTRSGTFREMAPVPAAKPLSRDLEAGVLPDGSVVVVGGNLHDDVAGDLSGVNVLSYRYDPRSNVWSRTGDLPEAQEWAFTPATLLSDGRLLLAGGRSPADEATGTVNGRTFIYEPNRSAVVNVIDPATGAPTGRKAVVAGRWDYTRTGDGRISAMTVGHFFGNATRLHDGRVLVVGGHSFWAIGEGSAGANTGLSVLATDTQFFDPATGAWTQGPPLPPVPGEDDTIVGSRGGRANGVCLATLPNGDVVIAGGGFQVDGQSYFGTLRTRQSILVMTPSRDPRNSHYQLSPNPIPSGVNYGGLFGDGGRNHVLCYALANGGVLIAGGQDNMAEDLYDTYQFSPWNWKVARGPDLVHGLALWGPDYGFPPGYQAGAISTLAVSMRNSQLVFAHDVLVQGGGYNGLSVDSLGSRRVEQLDEGSAWTG